MIYDFTISGDCLTLDSRMSAVSGGVNCYRCRFTFDKAWDNLTKFAVFEKDGKAVTVYLDGDDCPVPAELLTDPATIGVGVYGTRLEGEPYRISTNLSHIVIKEGAYREGVAPETPKKEAWEVFFAEASARIKDMADTERETIKGLGESIIREYFGDMEAILDEIIKEQSLLIGGGGK